MPDVIHQRLRSTADNYTHVPRGVNRIPIECRTCLKCLGPFDSQVLEITKCEFMKHSIDHECGYQSDAI